MFKYIKHKKFRNKTWKAYPWTKRIIKLPEIILTEQILKSESQEDNEKLKEENETEKLKEENENENENENKNEENQNNKNEDDYDYEYEDDKIIDQNWIIKEKNDYFDKIIDKSFEDQVKLFQKVENLDDYYYDKDFDEKELKSKMFKLKLERLSNIIEEKIFEQIFDHTLMKLADKLINITNKQKIK